MGYLPPPVKAVSFHIFDMLHPHHPKITHQNGGYQNKNRKYYEKGYMQKRNATIHGDTTQKHKVLAKKILISSNNKPLT